MNENNTYTVWGWIIGTVVILIILWGIWALWAPKSATPTADNSAAASQVLTNFGSQLQNVSLLAPDASTTIATTYSPYVDPTLLMQWENNPSLAPGRLASSPWPSGITVTNMTSADGGGYAAQGTISSVTSTGPAGSTSFSALVMPENGGWYITSFMQGSTTTVS